MSLILSGGRRACLARLARTAAHIVCLSVALCVGVGVSLGVSVPARADATDGFDVSTVSDGLTLMPFVSSFEDPSGALTLAQVQARQREGKFAALAGREPAFGFTRSAIWLFWRAENRSASSQRWLLEVGYPHLDHVSLHVMHADGRVESRESGDMLPFDRRDVADPSFVFELETAPHAHEAYFMRVQSSGSARVPLKAWEAHAFHAEATRRNMTLALFYGALIVMAVFNLGVFVLIRQSEYFCYVLLLLSFLVGQMTFSGHTFQYLLPHHPLFANRLMGLSLAVILLFIPLFARAVVTRSGLLREMRFYNIAFYAAWLPVLFAVFGPLRFALRGVLVLMACLCIAAVPHLRAMRRHDIEQIRQYLRSWHVVIYAIPIYILRVMHVIPEFPLSEWIVHIAATLSSVITSLALASRVSVMKDDLARLNGELSNNVAELQVALSHAELSAEDARRANRVKDDFMATMSHELRTPLNAIINVPQGLIDQFGEAAAGQCEQCQASFVLEAGEKLTADTPCGACHARGSLRPTKWLEYQGKPEVTIRFLRKIERAGQHLLRMVNTVLDASKMEAGRLELSLGPANLDEIIRDAVDQVNELAEQKQLQLRLLLPELQSSSTLDALRIKQVLLNLLSNAIKFCEVGSTVTISRDVVGDADVVSVQDQGIGIAPEHHERIFAGFEQVHTGETRKYGGTGLGLSISRSLVRMHGGELWVESALGRGSVFRFSLPRSRSGGLPKPSTAA